jgi:cysteine-rich repeat protein
VNSDACTNACTASLCGDGIVSPGAGEQCDDGNVVNGDGCDSNCTVTVCGNGIRTGTEQCDDGNVVNGDGCNAACLLE